MKPKEVKAKNVRAGDVLEVWWMPKRDTVRVVRPYEGDLGFMQGGFIFEFHSGSKMSAAPDDRFVLVAREAQE